MEEIIQKSKFFKEQKAREKEETVKLVEQMDKDFESLVQSDAFTSLTEPSKMNALKALVNPNFSKELGKKENMSASEVSKQDAPDTYDKLVSEMAFEMRARPSDRTKTPEEIAEEEKERLENLEKERQDRMRAADDASDEDGDDVEDDDKPSADKRSHISGDDLGDSFIVEDKSLNKKGWVDEILERNNAEDTEDEDSGCSDELEDSESDEGGTEDEEVDERAETLKDWEQSDDDVGTNWLNEENSDGEGGGEDNKMLSKTKEKKNDMLVKSDRKEEKKTAPQNSDKVKRDMILSSSLKQELPFKINAPGNMEELLALFQDRSSDDIIEAVRRIRVYNAIALAAENRKKMQVFYGLLLQYFATLANQKPLKLQLLNLLVKPLMEMSTEVPYFAAICARERILRTRTKFIEDIKDSEKSCWPSLKTLLLLRLWSMIFPCSDFRHAVMTPATLLMSEYLMRCSVLTVRDAAIGSFLCCIVLLVSKQSKKFCPEALLFLKALLLSAMDRDQRCSRDSQMFQHLLELKAPLPLLCIDESVKDIMPLDFLKIMNLPDDSSFMNSHGFRASVLVSVVETLGGFANIYGELKAFPEIFLPISALLVDLAGQQNMPVPLQEKLRHLVELIRTKAEEHHKFRQPLQMRKQKPVPIKLLNPKFEEGFIKGRDYDPDRTRAEKRKMAKLVRKEERGAVRELRKDNFFLQEVKEKERRRAEEERAEQYGKARAFLQEQEHNFKSGQLGKGRKRRR
ncbi:Nucleolar protein 14 [Bienertia sinuspersici]